MKHSAGLKAFLCVLGLFVALPCCAEASGQIVDNLGFKALPRPIHYATPLAPAGGAKAVIVYGKNAPWTQKAAEAAQKTILDATGLMLDLVDDLAATSDQTWLLNDAYRKTPMIVLGNAQDNRVMHAMGVRYMLQTNRAWPGGDRYLVRTVFEPFVADVNYITLEASTQAGLDGAVAKLAEIVKPLGKDPAIPFTRVVGGGKDTWQGDPWPWKIPTAYQGDPNRSAAQVAGQFKGTPPTVGELNYGSLWAWFLGGYINENMAKVTDMTPEKLRTSAGILLAAGRAWGSRITPDHYAMTSVLMGVRSAIQSGVLSDAEVNEFENFMVLAAAYPNEYYEDHIGSDSGFINVVGGRHCCAILLCTTNLLDHVRDHCRMDDKTRKEIERRSEGMRKCVGRYVRSFRDNDDTWEGGESTMMLCYAMLEQGDMEFVRNGMLRRAADMYMMTTDNLPDYWKCAGRYAGLDSYIGAGPGMIGVSWHGRGLVPMAAFYYDDPQYRWLAQWGTGRLEGYHGSVGAPFMPMHWDTTGQKKAPTLYNGVRALPFDERMYKVASDLAGGNGPRWWVQHPMKMAGPIDRLADRVSFRDGMDPRDAYMFLVTSNRIDGLTHAEPIHLNAIARYTDLGELWLYHNSQKNHGWARNVVSISNGKPYEPQIGATLESLANLGDVSIASSAQNDVSGANWTRTVVHLRGHYFAVLDRIEAMADDNFNMVCRWRTPQPSAIEEGAWVARSPSGAVMRVLSTDAVTQTSEQWDSDGGICPFVYSQFKQARLAKGQAATFQNLLTVAGENRPDSFEVRRVSDTAMLIKGKTAQGEHLAMIAAGGKAPLAGIETDAIVSDCTGNLLCLAGVTSLKAGNNELFRSPAPVNLMVDTDTGKAEVELSPDRFHNPVTAKVGGADTVLKPGTQAVSLPAGLPKTADLLAKLWQEHAAAPTAGAQKKPVGDVFQAIKGDKPLAMPLAKLSRMRLSTTPAPVQAIGDLTDGQYTAILPNNAPTWGTTDKLEITMEFPQPTDVSCLRLVGILRNGYIWVEKGAFGKMWNDAGDFTFKLVLSDDGFKNDNRVVEKPQVSFEETPIYPAFHYALGRLPTWRINVSAQARAIKILPRATKKEKPELCLTEVEAYGTSPAAAMSARAFAVDIDGDGGNELVVGSGNKEAAAYDASGKQLWSNKYPGEIFNMDCADLDESGKSQALVYTTTEELHRINGDGTERAVGDVFKAEMDSPSKGPWWGGMVAMAAWGPDDVKKKEVVMMSEGYVRVLPDGTVKTMRIGQSRGAGRVPNIYPGEPEVLAIIHGSVDLYSAKRTADGDYVHLGRGLQTAGPSSSINQKGFGWICPVNAGKFKGLLAANEGGLNYFPIEAFLPDSKVSGWGFIAGVPVTAALAQDIDGDGLPEIFLGREDGFVNVLRLEDGKLLGLLNTGGPILGIAVVQAPGGKLRLAVGSKTGVRLFDTDPSAGMKEIGCYPARVAAFAGPGGKQKDRLFVVAPDGAVTVLVIK